MAWTDQCKIAFMANAEHQVFTQKGRKNITKVLKKLSKESELPYNTLKRWYYEKEDDKKKRLNSINNDTTPELTENKEEAKNPTGITGTSCVRCEENSIEIQTSSGKPAGPNSRYYGLCASCRKKDKIMSDAIALANEEEKGEWVICPDCQHHFLIPNKEGIL